MYALMPEILTPALIWGALLIAFCAGLVKGHPGFCAADDHDLGPWQPDAGGVALWPG